jgi:hypothetical protein
MIPTEAYGIGVAYEGGFINIFIADRIGLH